MKVYGVVNIKL